MRNLAILICSMFTFSGHASECLSVRVADEDGMPISNAVVHVGFSTGNVIFGGGHGTGAESGHAEGLTDEKGTATIKFNCQSADFGWRVEANGYYRGDLHKEHFAFEEVLTPPAFSKVILHEHDKRGSETLFKIKHPAPMYAHYPIDRRKTPTANGRYGFDLAEYDWLPPEGKGKVADFYLVRDVVDAPEIGRYEVGRIVFDRDCGFYIGTKAACQEFPAAYRADVSHEFMTNIVLECVCHAEDGGWIEPLPIISKEQYIVFRTRVAHNEQGDIVSANYSRMLGVSAAFPYLTTVEAVFNPVPNDSNLEFDKSRNLVKERRKPPHVK